MAGKWTGEAGETEEARETTSSDPESQDSLCEKKETGETKETTSSETKSRASLYAKKETEETTEAATHARYQRGVVAVDRQGHEVARWEMVKDAHQDTGVAQSTISKSITGKRNSPFVRGVDLAFVAAEEWDDMTETQRRARLELD